MRRLKATHFMEVWKVNDTLITAPIRPIEIIDLCLRSTIEVKGKTIAVWKIKKSKPLPFRPHGWLDLM